MNLTYIFFCVFYLSGHFRVELTGHGFPDRGMKAQGRDLKANAYHNPLQPFVAYWGVFWTVFFILVNGFAVFFDFTASGFLTSCWYSLLFLVQRCGSMTLSLADINIPIFLVLYIGHKIHKRTKIWRPKEMDFDTVRLSVLYIFLS